MLPHRAQPLAEVSALLERVLVQASLHLDELRSARLNEGYLIEILLPLLQQDRRCSALLSLCFHVSEQLVSELLLPGSVLFELIVDMPDGAVHSIEVSLKEG